MNRIEDEDEHAQTLLRVVLVVLGACMLVWGLSGCPIRVDPTTDAVCPTLPNCGRCASDINCAWCPTEDDARGCYSRAALPAACGDIRVQLTERCPEDGPLGEAPPRTAP